MIIGVLASTSFFAASSMSLSSPAERVRRTVAREDGPATAIDTLVHAVREA